MQEPLPKVEEQKPSQFPQKKKWTKQDEQDLDECGGVLVDMVYSVDDPASRSISTSNAHGFVDLRVTNGAASQSDSGGGLTRLRGRMQDLVFRSTIPTRSPPLILNLETRYNTTVEQFTARQTKFQDELFNAGREEPNRNARETEKFHWGRTNHELRRNLNEHFRGDADVSGGQQRHFSGGIKPLPENVRWPGWKQTNPFCFVHVEGREQPGKIRLTYDNPNQTAIAVQIAADIRRRNPELATMIVALYYDQVESIREQLQEGGIADVPVYSFRSVQGNEANLVIFVTTRSNMLLEVGELREELGQVVAGSRSLQGMMIIGHLQTLAGGLEDSAPLKSHIWEIGQSGTVMKGSRWRGESTPGDMVEMPLDEFRDRFIYPRSLDIIIRNFPYQYSPSSLRSLFNAGGVGPRFSDYIQLREGRREEGSYGWLIGGFVLRAVSWQDLEEIMQFDRQCVEFIGQGSSPGRVDRRITKQLEAIPWSGTENQREIFDLTFRRLQRTLQDATRLTSILSLRGFHSGGESEILFAARSALRGLVVRRLELRDVEGEGRMILATVGDPANDIESSGMMREGLNRSATYLYSNAGRTSYIEINSWFPERQMNISR
ncbi:hypothetical protein WR25_06559 [Diploscapter pachys]|uniref:DNA2/NAM7 helicase-like C-terminal domain-containing protein n=1 Tax=Diploscapter pachys TaxID=2018661 RepID=A0A2A2JDQ3_9BILA|nr:hypothetical protein WR25_06559 [Diploscapter pachys]